MNLDFLKTEEWISIHNEIALTFHLKIEHHPKIREVIQKNIAISDFSINDIKSEFMNSKQSIRTFSKLWYNDCNKHEYGEEWDPFEGNQQPENEKSVVTGIGEGFLITYILFFLYAKYKDMLLPAYLKRIKMPYSKKVYKDIVRVFKQATNSIID